MNDIAIIALVLLIVGLAAGYVIKAKKKGRTCIGCPSGGCGQEGASCQCSGCSHCKH